MKDANGNIVNFTADNATTDSFKIKEKITCQTKNKSTKDGETLWTSLFRECLQNTFD